MAINYLPSIESLVFAPPSVCTPQPGMAAAVPRAESVVLELCSPPDPSGGSHRQDPQPVVVPLNFPHEEIQNVLWIEGSEQHRAALKEWDRKEAILSSRVDGKQKWSEDVTKQIVNLVWFFIVFQGRVLTTVAPLKSSTKPLCGMVWVPALFSTVAAGVTIIGVLFKFSTLQKLEISIHNEKVSQSALAARTTKLRAKGKNFNFTKHAKEGPGRKSNSAILILRIGIVFSLGFFSGLFILSHFVILCNFLVVDKWNQNLQ